jgi:hypothetical protein
MFEDLRESVASAFPQHKTSIKNFDQFLGFQLAMKCPQGIQKAVRICILSPHVLIDSCI